MAAADPAAPAAVLLGDACERILEFLDMRDLVELACASKACAACVRPRAATLRVRHKFFSSEAGLTAVLRLIAAHGTAELAAPRLVCKAWCRAAEPLMSRTFGEVETMGAALSFMQAAPGDSDAASNRPPRPRFLL